MGFGSIPNKLQQCAAWCIIHCLLSLPCSKRTSASKVCAACSSSTPLHPLGSRQHQQQQPGVVPCVWLRMVSEGKRKTLSKAEASSNSCQRSSPSHCVLTGGHKVTAKKLFQCFGYTAFLQSREDFAETQSSWVRCCSLGAAPWAGVTKVLLPLNLSSLQSLWKRAEVANSHIIFLPTGSSYSVRDTAHGYAFQNLQVYLHVSFPQQHHHIGLSSYLFPFPDNVPVVLGQLCCRYLQILQTQLLSPRSLPYLHCALEGAREGEITVPRAIASGCYSKICFKAG